MPNLCFTARVFSRLALPTPGNHQSREWPPSLRAAPTTASSAVRTRHDPDPRSPVLPRLGAASPETPARPTPAPPSRHRPTCNAPADCSVPIRVRTRPTERRDPAPAPHAHGENSGPSRSSSGPSSRQPEPQPRMTSRPPTRNKSVRHGPARSWAPLRCARGPACSRCRPRRLYAADRAPQAVSPPRAEGRLKGAARCLLP